MSPAAHAASKRSRTGVAGSGAPRGRPVAFGYIPALDGLRALAVLGVMMYHGGAPILGGGFLTIDVFFVLSGFLITSLLVGEWQKRTTIHLGQFWARRARRLLPALLVMLLGVAVYAKFFATPDEFVNLRLDALSSLFYVANWHFIFAGTNYFALSAQPSPLQHMWSLSIEEQFYLVWPPVVLAMLWLGRKLRPARRLWPLLAVAVGGAVGSAVDMRLLYHGPASVMRIYEGTDTRSQDLLVGAALAVAMMLWAQHRQVEPSEREPLLAVRAHPATGMVGTVPPRAHRRDRRRRRGPSIRPITAWEINSAPVRVALQILGWIAIATFAYLWSHLGNGPTSLLYRGGYLLVALGVGLVIVSAVTNQRGAIARALGNPVFRYVGKISYGTYLWHFPLFAVLSASRLHLLGYPLLATRIGATLVVATGSFYLVEEPIRRGRVRSLVEWRAWLATSAAVALVVGVTVVATIPVLAEAAPASRFNRPVGSEYIGAPVRVAVLGDSVAYRFGLALSLGNAAPNYDVNIDNGAIVGCGVVLSTQYRAHGAAANTVSSCNTSTPPSERWPAQWSGDLQEFRPDVVMMLVGRWEVTDRLINGTWMHIGEPAFDAILRRSLQQAVRIATSTGAPLVAMTSPCFSSGEQDNGQPWPEDSATRLAKYNSILREVAAQFPQRVTVEDFNALLCPGGKFQTDLGGVQLRDADGVHIVPTAAAGSWLAARVLPLAVATGRRYMEGKPLIRSTPAS